MAEKKPVDEECRSLLTRLADPAGPVWEGSVILRLTVRYHADVPLILGFV